MEPQGDAPRDSNRKSGVRRDVRAAAIGGLVATFVVAAAFAPRLLDHPSTVTVHQTGAEVPVTDTTDTTATPTTTTTAAPTTTTTAAAPTTTTTSPPPPPVTSDPKVRVHYEPDPDATVFVGTLVAENGYRPGLKASLNMVPFWPAWPGGPSGADASQGKPYTFVFPQGVTSIPISIPKSDWPNGAQITYFSPQITSYAWDAGSHAYPVTSCDDDPHVPDPYLCWKRTGPENFTPPPTTPTTLGPSPNRYGAWTTVDTGVAGLTATMRMGVDIANNMPFVELKVQNTSDKNSILIHGTADDMTFVIGGTLSGNTGGIIQPRGVEHATENSVITITSVETSTANYVPQN